MGNNPLVTKFFEPFLYFWSNLYAGTKNMTTRPWNIAALKDSVVTPKDVKKYLELKVAQNKFTTSFSISRASPCLPPCGGHTSPWPIYMKHHYPRKTHGTLKGQKDQKNLFQQHRKEEWKFMRRVSIIQRWLKLLHCIAESNNRHEPIFYIVYIFQKLFLA